MAHNTETVRNTGSFRVEGGRLMLFRMGPANGQPQRHNRAPRDMVTGDKTEWDRSRGDYREHSRIAPAPRGYWAFPYPFQDAFFYAHVWDRHLPKHLRKGTCPEEEPATSEWVAEYHKVMKEIRRRERPRIVMHGGAFWSRIQPRHVRQTHPWYRYENAREWVEEARRQLWCWQPGYSKDGPWKANYSVDHLELFVPC